MGNYELTEINDGGVGDCDKFCYKHNIYYDTRCYECWRESKVDDSS